MVNDTKNSIYRIVFGIFEGNRMHSHTVKETDKIIHHWHRLLSYLINLADSERDNGEDIKNKSSSNVADELKTFSELLKDGYLTQKEYEVEKQKLLNR